MHSSEEINLNAEAVLRKLKQASDDLYKTIQQSQEILRSLPTNPGVAAQQPEPDGSGEVAPPA
jgi:hypothetical protein